jgi:cytochrome d ubiquinol oxidase subunit II
MIATHGAVYLALRTQGDLADRARRWAQKAWTVYFILFIVSSVSTVLTQPHLLLNYRAAPVLWVFAVLPLAGIALIGFWNRRGNAGRAFAASSFSIVMIMIKTGVALFPRLVPALGQPELSLTIWNASSSQRTLWTMLVLVLIGMPVVIGYSIWTYRVFAGRVTAEDESY